MHNPNLGADVVNTITVSLLNSVEKTSELSSLCSCFCF